VVPLRRYERLLDIRSIAVLRRATSGSRITFNTLGDAPRASRKL
jgi:hypothetical protein